MSYALVMFGGVVSNESFEHWCENCGKREILTPDQAFHAGWDFPPRMGAWGVISPRTCGDCGIETTLWWALQTDELTMDDPMSWPENRRRALAWFLNEAEQNQHR